MKLALIILWMILPSCAFFSKKADNSTAIDKYEKKMRSLASFPYGYKLHKTSLTLVGPDADVILFYKDGDEIVIKVCERYSVIDKRSDCQSDLSIRVSVEDFKNRLKLALRVPDFDTLGQKEAEQLKAYREELNQQSVQDLERQRDEVQRQENRILGFVKRYENPEIVKNCLDPSKTCEAESIPDPQELSDLRLRIEEFNKKINDGQGLSGAVKGLNSAIESLVDNVIGVEGDKIPHLSYSRDKTGIEYSVLRSFVKPYVNISEVPFVPVKAGEFMMGSPGSEKGRDGDELRHRVILKKDFEISPIEVTQFQWFDVMGGNPSYFKEERYCPGSHMERDGFSMCALFPVESVSHKDVKKFLKAYNERAERKGEGYEYRLPTEAEWEYAARGGTTTAYSFGDNVSDLKKYGWYSENSGGQTRVVATKGPNPLGLYDVHGNVWEWVEDWYKEDYPVGPLTDPRGPEDGSYRVLRGGSWFNFARNLRSANRGINRPEVRNRGIGFRLVRTPR